MPTPTEKTKAKRFMGFRSHYEGVTTEESHRKVQITQVAIPTLYSPQEGLRQGTFNSGFVNPKQLHKSPVIQNVDSKGSKTPPSSRLLDYVHRPSRWILACPNITRKETLSRIFLLRSRLAVSGNAIWPQHSTKDIYQDNLSCDPRVSSNRNLVPSLLRRSAHYCTLKGSLSTPHKDGSSSPRTAGIFNQQQEISAGSTTSFPLVGNRVGSNLTHSPGLHRKGTDTERQPNKRSTLRLLHKTQHAKYPGFSQLGRHVRQDFQADSPHHETHLKTKFKKILRRSHQDSKEPENTLMQMENRHMSHISTSTFRISSTKCHHTDRCHSKGVGSTNRPISLSRRLRRFNELFNKCVGALNSMVCPPPHFSTRHSYSNSVRQSHSHTCAKKRRVSILSSVIPSRTNLEKGSKVQMDTSNITHQRSIQCDSRHAVEKRPSFDGMVPFNSRFPTDSSTRTSPRSGPLCNELQQQTINLPIPMSRPLGNGSGCSSNSMGEVEIPIHISTDTLDLQSSGKDNEYPFCKGSSDHARYPNEALVHVPTTQEDTISTSKSSTVPGSSRQSSDTTLHLKPSRVDVITKVYEEQLSDDPRVLGLLTTPLLPSSSLSYQNKWMSFCNFIKDHFSSVVTLENVFKFFTHLFYDKNLKPGTIAKYRSAIAEPLRLRFNIILENNKEVKKFFRAMRRKRPNAPITSPLWSLNKVLIYIDDMTGHLNVEQLLQKSAFLLLLATGWRISELQACVRDEEFCFINRSSTLLIRPHSSFLAKNESYETRWQHKSINSLQLTDGSPSHLCPVRSLQEYLRRTSRVKEGPLYIHPSTQRPMSIYQLSTTICKLIQTAEPSVKAKVHDVRKYASSQSLLETMQISEVVEAVNWRSPHTFWKYYMFPTKPLVRAAVLPGSAASSKD